MEKSSPINLSQDGRTSHNNNAEREEPDNALDSYLLPMNPIPYQNIIRSRSSELRVNYMPPIVEEPAIPRPVKGSAPSNPSYPKPSSRQSNARMLSQAKRESAAAAPAVGTGNSNAVAMGLGVPTMYPTNITVKVHDKPIATTNNPQGNSVNRKVVSNVSDTKNPVVFDKNLPRDDIPTTIAKLQKYDSSADNGSGFTTTTQKKAIMTGNSTNVELSALLAKHAKKLGDQFNEVELKLKQYQAASEYVSFKDSLL